MSTPGSSAAAPERATPRAEVRCALARDGAELAAHHAIRRAVFVDEQALFAHDDRDEHDVAASTRHALGAVAGRPAGAVRLYPHDDAGLRWRGDRLAVLRAERHTSLGAALVRFAVATAGGLGGERMDAMIQLANVRFFLFLGWELDGAHVRYHGRSHQPMAIGLRPGPVPGP